MNKAPQTVCTLYRNILKAMRHYPSTKRERLLVAIKEEFRDHASETDPKKLERYIRDAKAGLQQIEQFSKNNKRGTMEYTIGK